MSFIGRERLVADLQTKLGDAQRGNGQLVLLAGEAGVGKTRLAAEVLAQHATKLAVLHVPGGAQGVYGPIVAALRAYRRTNPENETPFRGPLKEHLHALLPELGPPPRQTDKATLVEALRCAFEAIACHQPTAVFLDDLHDADHATLELLPELAAAAQQLPLFLLGAYRADEIGRDHPLRSMRTALRRAGRLHELQLAPLDAAESTALAQAVLGQPITPLLAQWLFDRTQGLPLFVEELTGLLVSTRAVRERDGALDLAPTGTELPVPETVRDLVLLRGARLNETARSALEVAAVAGVSFDLDLVARLSGGDDALGEAFASGLLLETGERSGAFRHPLMRDAVYSDIAWPRRRALHRSIAEELEASGSASAIVLADHWLAARELERARRTLLSAGREAADVHAYRDAAVCARRALELWPEGREDAERLSLLDRLGHWAQLSGSLANALGAWRQVASAHSAIGNQYGYAVVQRQMAAVFELQGIWDAALNAREAAAEAFASCERYADAAAERLVAAAHLRSAGTFDAALEILGVAAEEAARAERLDLQARALGLEGNVRARMGDHAHGLELVRAGLAIALEHNLTAAASEVYQRLADSLEQGGEYAAARQTYTEAAEFCETHGASPVAQVCLACLTVVLRQTGEWAQCERVCREVLENPESPAHARAVGSGVLGSVYALRGDARRARSLLNESLRLAEHIELAAMELLAAWGLAITDELEGRADRAVERCQCLLERWSGTQERHFVVPALRWSATLFSSQADVAGVRACADGLGRIVAQAADLEAVAALAHALGEVSLSEGDAAAAVEHFDQAYDRLSGLELPFERAHTALRAGIALIAAGRRELGVQRLREANRLAQPLGALPLAAAAARQLVALDSRSAANGLLSRREQEVAALLARGCTNREIAERLVISERTAENHVQRMLNRLGLRSRAQIAAWAVQQGLASAR